MADVCKIGDTVWRLCKNSITETKVVDIQHYPHAVYKLEGCADSYFERAFGKRLFLSLEDANKAVLRSQNIAEKRELLKEYERELNMKFDLENHFIVK